MSTPLWSGDHLYVLDKRDGLLCIHWPSGKVVWTDDHRLTPKGAESPRGPGMGGGRPFQRKFRGLSRGPQRRG